jgi:hypothetical protein
VLARPRGQSTAFAKVWPAAIPAIALLAKLHGLYDRDRLLLRKTTLDQAPQLLQVVALATLGLWLVVDAPSARRSSIPGRCGVISPTVGHTRGPPEHSIRAQEQTTAFTAPPD